MKDLAVTEEEVDKLIGYFLKEADICSEQYKEIKQPSKAARDLLRQIKLLRRSAKELKDSRSRIHALCAGGRSTRLVLGE